MTGQVITTHYETDHDRLDDLFSEFRHFKRTDFRKAKEFFKQFMFGLQRHIVWEEDILFPLFERKTGMAQGGPTFVMRSEHRQIIKHLEAIHEKVRTNNPESDDDEQSLLNVLGLHNQKEERVLYPAIDRMVSQEELDSIFKQMESIPEERYKQCCSTVEQKAY